MFFILPCRKHI